MPTNSSARASRPPKRIANGVRVSGAVGPLIPNPNPAISRRHKQRLFGTVISACERNRYQVRFDDGTLMECASSILRIEVGNASLPPDAIEESMARGDEAILESADAHDVFDSEPLLHEEGDNDPEDDAEAGEAEDNLAGGAEVEDNPVGERPVGNLEQAEPETTYEGRKQAALRRIAALAGEQVPVKKGRMEEVVWTVVPDSHPDVERMNDKVTGVGLKNIDSIMRKAGNDIILAYIFLHILFSDWKEKLQRLNVAIEAENTKARSGKKIPLFTPEEFCKALGIFIAAAGYNCKGVELWRKESGDAFSGDASEWPSVIPPPNFDRYMSANRFKQWRKFIPLIWANEALQLDGKQDPWWQFAPAVSEFNEHRREIIQHSSMLVADESMSAWVPRTSKTGGLPNISFIKRKPEPLGKFILPLLIVVYLLCSLIFFSIY